MVAHFMEGGDFSISGTNGATCSLTGNIKRSTDRGVWYGPEADNGGLIQISQAFVEEAADALGWTSPRAVDMLHELLEWYQTERESLLHTIESMNTAFNSVEFVRDYLEAKISESIQKWVDDLNELASGDPDIEEE